MGKERFMKHLEEVVTIKLPCWQLAVLIVLIYHHLLCTRGKSLEQVDGRWTSRVLVFHNRQWLLLLETCTCNSQDIYIVDVIVFVFMLSLTLKTDGSAIVGVYTHAIALSVNVNIVACE